VTVKANQAGDANYTAASSVSQTLIVNPATLTVTANNISQVVGTASPAYSAIYRGFVNGDTAAILGGSPAYSTTATAASPVGLYPITITQGTLIAANYNFTFVNGTISVVAAPTIVITTTATITGSAATGYTARITVKNTGTGAATNVVLTTATLGSAAGSVLPASLGTIAGGGGSSIVTLTFPGSAGSNGAAVVEKFAGAYAGGSFSASSRGVLP
jgi:hypothetical protein